MLNTSLAQLLCTPAYIFCVYSIFILSALGEVTFAVPLVFAVLNIFTDSWNRLFPIVNVQNYSNSSCLHEVSSKRNFMKMMTWIIINNKVHHRTGQAAIDK